VTQGYDEFIQQQGETIVYPLALRGPRLILKSEIITTVRLGRPNMFDQLEQSTMAPRPCNAYPELAMRQQEQQGDEQARRIETYDTVDFGTSSGYKRYVHRTTDEWSRFNTVRLDTLRVVFWTIWKDLGWEGDWARQRPCVVNDTSKRHLYQAMYPLPVVFSPYFLLFLFSFCLSGIECVLL
jgi:hypothetical protein